MMLLQWILVNINRMKSLYLNDNQTPKTIGYQDFSNMYATIGKIRFWKMLGLDINDDIINEKFVDEFNKSFSFFLFLSKIFILHIKYYIIITNYYNIQR